ncbi:EpsG family protein [Faecalibacter macacae]|uniref:EpsG family protein n=1 Tax=Faecalibacter macacae TaxID=1859289 RepID=A0A3L9MI37_9FLAO|nr:EpsG family protein [Faecalibacter macacae]RLZ12733.1 EpsG family protein [Faecalibacter macacae]
MSFIYYFIFSLLVITSLIEFNKNERGNKYWYSIIVIIMILTAGLGYDLSPDWVAYHETFKLLQKTDWSQLTRFSDMASMEVGYLSLNKILGSFKFDFGAVTLLMATLSLILKSTTFYKYGGIPFFVLFMYAMPNYMFEDHIHIRQGLATAIAVYSVKYIIDRKLLKFLVCIVIGYQFHESIIVFILAYWVVKVKFNEIVIGWLVTLTIIANYVGALSVIEIVMQYMPIAQEKFEDYQYQLVGNETGVALGDIVKILTVIAILVYNKYADHDKLYCIFRNIFIVGVLMYFFFGKGIFGIRLPGYFLIFLGLTLGRMLYVFTGDKLFRAFVYFSFLIYTIALIFWFQVQQGSVTNFDKYRTFFSSGSVYGLWKD